MPSNAQNHLDLPLPCMSITKARDLFQDMPTPDANMPIGSQVTEPITTNPLLDFPSFLHPSIGQIGQIFVLLS